MQARPRRRTRLLLVLGATLLLAEGAVRVVERARGVSWTVPESPRSDEVLYEPHPYVGYTMRPGFTAFEGTGFDARTNSHGFRGPEIAAEKPARTLRIACLGGSTTFCTGVGDEAHTWPAVVEELLDARLADGGPWDDVEVLNAGVSGYTLLESFVNLKMRVLPLRPDVVVVYHGVNDARAIRRGDFRPDYTHMRRAWTEPWRPVWTDRGLRWSRLYGLLRGRGRTFARPTITDYMQRPEFAGAPERAGDELEPGIRNYATTLREVAALARVHGAEVVLCTFTWRRPGPGDDGPPLEPPDPGLVDALRRLNAAVRAVAAEEGALLVDLDALGPHARGDYVDLVHQSRLGCFKLGQHVARALAARSPRLRGALRPANGR